MKACPQCNAELPDEARFCLACGAPQGPAPAAQARVEGAGAAAQAGGVAAGAGGVAVGGDVRESTIVASNGNVVRAAPAP